MKLVIATENEGKLKEFKELLFNFNFEIISKKEAGIFEEIEETGTTFSENAKIKAEYVFSRTNLPTLADDSGLEVFALNNEPGIFSARYSNDDNGPATDEKNNEKLLKNMQNIKNRAARYVCALCFINSSGKVFEILKTVEGEIAKKLTGKNGFGYDPLFLFNGKSFAQIPSLEKHKISHRGKAMLKLKQNIKNWL